MPEFALYRYDVFERFDTAPERHADFEPKGIKWYPVIRGVVGEPFEGIEGDAHVVRTVDPATLPPPVPRSISDRQFFQQLAVRGLISETEAEDAVASGVLPASLAELVELLPEQARHPARMLLKGATVFLRNHEMTDTIAWLYGFDSGEVDTLFIEAAQL